MIRLMTTKLPTFAICVALSALTAGCLFDDAEEGTVPRPGTPGDGSNTGNGGNTGNDDNGSDTGNGGNTGNGGDTGGGGSTGSKLDCRNAATWPADWVAFEDKVLVLVNEHRAAGATCGGNDRPAVGPLTADAKLREAARCHSLDMATKGYFSHDSADGKSPWDRIKKAGYTGSSRAENIAAGQSTPEKIVQSWMKSDGHCENIMSGDSNEIGVGYAFKDGSPFGHYGTQTFGVR